MTNSTTPPFSADGRDTRASVREQLEQGAGAMTRGSRASADLESWNPSIADRIQSLGFVGDATRAFDLLPLVLVAWSDGTIQPEERAKILDVLRLRGLAESSAFTMFEALLESEPAEVYLHAALELLKELVADRGDGGVSVVDLCIEVAAAASDAIGSPDPISAEERNAIARVAQNLGPDAHAEVSRQLNERG